MISCSTLLYEARNGFTNGLLVRLRSRVGRVQWIDCIWNPAGPYCDCELETFVYHRGRYQFTVCCLHSYIFVLCNTKGVPSVIAGIIALFVLPDRPESTRFLNESERVIAVERMNRSISSDTGAVIKKGNYSICNLI